MKTPKEVANYLGRPITMNAWGKWHWYEEIPYHGFAIWYMKGYGIEHPLHFGLLPDSINIEYTGHWHDSLTLPDGWNNNEPSNHGAVVMDAEHMELLEEKE